MAFITGHILSEGLATGNRRRYSFFVRDWEGEGRSSDRNLAGTVSGGLHASRDYFYRTAIRQKTTSTRGNPVGSPAAAMSGLRRSHDHRPRTASPPGPRRTSRSHLGATRNLSSLREDLHDLAQLARTGSAFQLALPRAGL